MGGRSMKDVGGAVLAGSTPPFLGRERAAVNVDVGPERRSPRYHETYLALESVEESSAVCDDVYSQPFGDFGVKPHQILDTFLKKGGRRTVPPRSTAGGGVVGNLA